MQALSGNSEEARALLDQSRAVYAANDDLPQFLYLRAAFAMQTGNPDRALVFLRDALDAGLRSVDLKEASTFKGLHGRPEFESLVLEYDRRNREEEPDDRVALGSQSGRED